MKRKIRIATLLITIPLVGISLAGCALGTSPEQKNESADLPTDKDLISTYVLQIEHYEELIQRLENDLLYIKEENYITAAEYQQKIKELEAALNALSSKNEIPDTPHTGTLDKNDNEVINPPSDLSVTSFSISEIDGKLTVTGYSGNQTELDIPSQIDGSALASIGESAFADSNIKKITLPDTVTTIGWFAFSGCKELREITIPESVSLIGYGAFDGCSSDLVIVCAPNSYAERYAQSWGIAYRYD